jgi:hypothetical protein
MGQFVDRYRNEVGGILGEMGVGSKDCSNRLADVAEPVSRQQRCRYGRKASPAGSRKSIGGRLAMSAPVHTAATPGEASAAVISTDRSSAWA